MRNKFLSVLILIYVTLFACGTILSTEEHSSESRLVDVSNKSDVATKRFVWPYEKSDLKPDPAIKTATLENNFKYVLMNNNEPKNRVSIHLVVQVGSLYEADGEEGIAHFLEHMLFCGSEHFKPGELVKYFQSIGMQFGADANAQTGFNETVYDIILPDGNKKTLEEGLVVMKDYAESALILASEVDRERNVILAEKRARDSASYRAFVSTLNFELPGSKISKRLPIGKEDVITGADRNLLKDFYDAWYRPENMILVVVGDIDTELATSLIQNVFSSLSPRAPPKPLPETGTFHHTGIKPFYHYEKEAGNTSVTIEVINKIHPPFDSLALEKKLLAMNIANQMIQNRLDKMVRHPDAPFTAASISSGTYLKEIEYAAFSAECSPDNWNNTLSLIEQTLRGAIAYGFTETELERVKKDMLAEFDKAVKTSSTRGSENLSQSIIQSLMNERVFQSPEQKQQLFEPIVKFLTANQVHDVFKKSWGLNHRLVMVTGNINLKGTGDTSPERQILSVMNKSSKTRVLPPAEEKPVKFPYLPDPVHVGKITGRKNIPDLGIIQIDFENNIRLNLKKTDFKDDEVIFTLCFGLGRSEEPENKPGLSILSSQVVTESGLGKMDKDNLEKAFAGKNTRLWCEVNEDSIVFRGQSVTDEIPLLFQLIYAYMEDTAFREDAYRLVMERYKQTYDSLSHTIDGAMEIYGESFLAGGDSRFGLPPYDVMKQNTLADIRLWITTALKNSDIELSLAGDFDTNLAIEMASKYIGSIPRKKPINREDVTRVPEFPDAKSITLNVPTKIEKAMAQIAYPTDDFWDISRTRRLSILGEVLSEKLRVRIREKLGAAYSPYSFNRSSRAYPGYGMVKVVTTISPDDIKKIIPEITEIASDIVKNGITEEELNRSLWPVLTHLKDMRRTNDYWLNSVLSGSKRHPQQIDWCRTIQDDYASITVQDITAVARKYLDNEKAAVVIIIPE